MRILLGGFPKWTSPGSASGTGRPIRQPGPGKSAALAALAGTVILAAVIALSGVHSYFHPITDPDPSYEMDNRVIPWAGMLFFFLLGIVVHEFLHALLYPDRGRSNSTLLIFNWKRLQFGAYYEDRISRRRWIAMRLFPMLALTGLALAVLFVFYSEMTFTVESCLWVVILTNALGSGGDLAAVFIVLPQVPPGGALDFYRGRAYGLTAEEVRRSQRPAATINAGESSSKVERS
jgi:hypothetical protein